MNEWTTFLVLTSSKEKAAFKTFDSVYKHFEVLQV